MTILIVLKRKPGLSFRACQEKITGLTELTNTIH